MEKTTSFIEAERMKKDMAFTKRILTWMCNSWFFSGTKFGTWLGLLIIKHLVNFLSTRWIKK